ncbi:MAG: hypothetical protein GX354_01925 [Firmicutes bacterium]|jgi:hypothetical protein|nr:hypothetical protein [Bacillota bacterium]
MGKRRRRRKEVGAFGTLAQEGLQSLDKIRAFLTTAESVTNSLHSLMGSYQVMQADGSLQKLLSMVKDAGTGEAGDE